jgi:hypothetical protein
LHHTRAAAAGYSSAFTPPVPATSRWQNDMALLDELTPRQRKFVLQQRVIQILNEVMVTALCTALQHSATGVQCPRLKPACIAVARPERAGPPPELHRAVPRQHGADGHAL